MKSIHWEESDFWLVFEMKNQKMAAYNEYVSFVILIQKA